MGKIRTKKKTLYHLFLKQVIIIAAAVIVEIVLFVGLFYIGLYSGIILPANYDENYLLQIEEQLNGNVASNESILPETCEICLFDSAGAYIDGNAKHPEMFEKVIRGQANRFGYRVLEIEEGYLVINYSVTPRFANQVLHKIIPNPQNTLIIVFILVFVLIIVASAFSFGKKLKKKMTPLLTEIESIKDRELSAVINNSDIQEFDEILLALGDMKAALTDSLKKEWAAEQLRKENISALAHDIKTPLTVIKGNAELLAEEKEIEEIYGYAEKINENADKIEQYIKLLIDEANGVEKSLEEISLSELIALIKKESENVCTTKRIPIIIKDSCEESSERKIAAAEGIQRAVLNVVTNAIEHTDAGEGIKLSFEEVDEYVSIKVEDYGPGFSKEALEHATNQFFTERKERSGAHYGLGLFQAENVAKEHNGELCITNKGDGDGAVVDFTFR